MSKAMKDILKKTVLTVTIGIFALSGCDVAQTDKAKELSEEDLVLASSIIASSLADDDGGIISTFYDAFSGVTPQGLVFDQIFAESKVETGIVDCGQYRDCDNGSDNGSGNRWGNRGESGFRADYDPETGEHTVHFVRSFERALVSKLMEVNAVYIFKDTDENFLAFPRRLRELVETISYRGTREGSMTRPLQSNTVFRADTLFFAGVSSESPVMTMEGVHHANGEMSMEIERPDYPTERSYTLFFEFDDVQMDKTVLDAGGSLEEAVTGFINYQMSVSSVLGGELIEEEFSGVIEFTGDGYAWLQFYRIPDFFRIALKDGSTARNPNRGGNR